jgi:hypothetical protein
MTNATTLVHSSDLAVLMGFAMATSSHAFASPPDRPRIWVDGPLVRGGLQHFFA